MTSLHAMRPWSTFWGNLLVVPGAASREDYTPDRGAKTERSRWTTTDTDAIRRSQFDGGRPGANNPRPYCSTVATFRSEGHGTDHTRAIIVGTGRSEVAMTTSSLLSD